MGVVRAVCPEDSTRRLQSVALGSGASPLLGLLPALARLSPGAFPQLVVRHDWFWVSWDGRFEGSDRCCALPSQPSLPPRGVRGTACGERARHGPGGSVDRGVMSSVRPNRVLLRSRVEPRRASARGPFLWIAPAAVPVVLPCQAGGLGRRLAADVELMRTRGIRLFN
ncbi:hypothetical protein chiPu_0022321 [Chiloscyllium punctatum]|uniref:Uncharacterized protein n=1 Tax=Chiloscyllium punctatum TaxID=137246 RepID=A0A401RI58_CHIPU|nr:hypothetical protein [Chiloscyllium punctatum]